MFQIISLVVLNIDLAVLAIFLRTIASEFLTMNTSN